MRNLKFPLFLLALLLVAAPVLGQAWAGQGRVSGIVLDADEHPLAGAEVRLTQLESEDGPPAVKTDKKGRWALLGLAPGRWRIVISADGFIQSDGLATVVNGPSDRVRVVLRPISETTGSFAESAVGVHAWLDKGNSLLEQGQGTAARAEYEKALPYLAPEQRGEILRAVARSYALDRDLDGAVGALQKALIYTPSDTESRTLYSALLDGFGRGAEAEAWLARLDGEGPGALGAELGMMIEEEPDSPTARPLDDAPVLEAEAHRVGTYRLRLPSRDPLSALAVFTERLGQSRTEIEGVDPQAARYDMAEESFEVIVPESYSADGEPWGLFVWVSPTNSGRLRRPDNLQVLEEERMLWIGANNSGNRRKVWDRVGLALDAASGMKGIYNIDPARVYVGGYSGGGRMATWLAMLYPEHFHGGFFVSGVDFYEDVPMPDKPGAHWPAAFPVPPKATWPQIKERSHYVFFTGENDFNRLQTKEFSRLYEKAGFRHIHYLEIPGGDHYSGFSGDTLRQVIKALDGK